jgi:hypothetical protein
VLSFMAFLTVLGRTFVDSQYLIPEQYPSAGRSLAGLGIMAFFGSWIWVPLAAARGGRGGLIAALIHNLIFSFFSGLYSLLILCPSTCTSSQPLMEIALWANLTTAGIASISVGLQLWGSRGDTDRPWARQPSRHFVVQLFSTKGGIRWT